jgi:hypothetical protein
VEEVEVVIEEVEVEQVVTDLLFQEDVWLQLLFMQVQVFQ